MHNMRVLFPPLTHTITYGMYEHVQLYKIVNTVQCIVPRSAVQTNDNDARIENISTCIALPGSLVDSVCVWQAA